VKFVYMSTLMFNVNIVPVTLCDCRILCRDSSVCIATGYGLDCRASVPGEGQGFFFVFSITSKSVLGSTQSPIQLAPGALSPGVKQPGSEADHSTPCSAEVKNGGVIPSLRNMSSWRGS
jgi:hypothetical protein